MTRGDRIVVAALCMHAANHSESMTALLFGALGLLLMFQVASSYFNVDEIPERGGE